MSNNTPTGEPCPSCGGVDRGNTCCPPDPEPTCYMVARFAVTGWNARELANLRGKLIEAGDAADEDRPSIEPSISIEAGKATPRPESRSTSHSRSSAPRPSTSGTPCVR